jgi:hypothetical protein
MSMIERRLRLGRVAHTLDRRGWEVKYMVMMFGGVGEVLTTKTPEWLANMHSVVQELDQELKESGEVVGGGRLVEPNASEDGPLRGRRADHDRRPVRRDQGVARRLLDHRR